MAETLQIRENENFIEVLGTGFFTKADACLHLDKLASAIHARRVRRQSIAVLVDLREALVQAPDVARDLSVSARTLYQSGDRIAIVTGSMLQRKQVKRLADDQASFHLFASRDEAEAFLTS